MTIRVLVVDDSALMRKIISDILNSDPDIKVIDTARNGQIAVEKVEQLRPDVVTLDHEMPVLDGLHALGYIMSECPTPVIMLSAADERGAELTLNAFEYGAVDFIQKPSGTISRDIEQIAQEIRSKVKAAAKAQLKNLHFMEEHVISSETRKTHSDRQKQISNPLRSNPRRVMTKKILAIGSSTGGPRALEQVIPKLPQDLRAAVLVVQHMPAGFTASLAQRLNSQSALEVREAKDGDLIQEGVVLIAPGDYHMEVIQKMIDGKTVEVISLNKEPRELGVRPCVNVLFRTLAPIYGANILSVIMTGMGTDGAEGVEKIKQAGGKAIAEDERSCIVYGMPKAIVDRGLADRIVPLEMIATTIQQLI
ncbi:chemotaxis response regulator protein-glutamate methylesterase [uncultured Methanomethylovorans sp.]|uniref:protein-glutamate methylesterase/protein-glutamine glutaminase n=2 Tax=Methanomethylovorans TaxID=101191 RepID=UPI002615B7FA|nr:chemotaxis response regulator protein-glutamate methylesterase [uncultured Methanomethylovorans sp.]